MKYDVAIIGGGLAGCSAAIRLVKKGFTVVLCEASDYPHHKVCGEFMSSGCRPQLAALGVENAVWNMGATKIGSMLLTTPDNLVWQRDLPESGMGISRYQLDDLLAKKAQSCGVDLLTKTKVVEVEGTLETGFTLCTQDRNIIHAETVTGAYGKRSPLDNKLNRRFIKHNQPFVGLKQHVRQLPLSGRVELHTFQGGYCGIAEIENGLTNICLLVREEIFREQGSVEKFIDWMLSQNATLAGQFRKADFFQDHWLSIAQIPLTSKTLVENDMLMAGDASGMITPLTGDGMEIALQSGEIVANQLVSYFETHRDGQKLISDYCNAWHQTFDTRIRFGRISQFFILRPAWLKWGLGVFRAVPKLDEFFIHHTRS